MNWLNKSGSIVGDLQACRYINTSRENHISTILLFCNTTNILSMPLVISSIRKSLPAVMPIHDTGLFRRSVYLFHAFLNPLGGRMWRRKHHTRVGSIENGAP